MNLRAEFDVRVAGLNAKRSQKFAAKRREQPALYFRSIANLMRALGKNKKCLLRQIPRLHLVFGQRQCEPVKGGIKSAYDRFKVQFVTHNFYKIPILRGGE